jgi:hypothetical protein
MQKLILTLSLLAVVSFAVSVNVPSAHAQAISGDITGVVRDASKAVLVKANVVATNVETGVAYPAFTNEVGQYRLSNLPPGTYDIEVSAQGFTKSKLKGFVVELNKISTADFSLNVVTAHETVEVSAEAGVALDTTTAQVEASFSSEQLTELPAATNNVLNLSLMTAGVASSGGMGQGTGPSVGGQRPTSNNFMVEGIDNNNRNVPGPLLSVPSDAVAEFSTLQNQFSAEYGHSNGGQFNQIIKSGTNQFHGVVYEYSQNRNYNAIDASTARAQSNKNVTAPRYDDNRFGGQVGGPIVRNKLFFFSNYEQEPNGTTNSESFCAPTAAGFTTLSGLSGLNQNNLSTFVKYSPVASTQALASDALCPQTVTVAGTAIPTGKVGLAPPAYTNNYRSLNAVDYTLSEKDNIRVRYLFNRVDAIDTTATFQPFWIINPSRYHLATFSEFHTFSPALTNELRIGYNRYYNNTPAPGTFPGMTVFPNLTIDELNIDIGPDSTAPGGMSQDTYQGSDSVIWVRGEHTFKAGYEFRDVITPQLFVQRVRGDYEWGTDQASGESGLGLYLRDLSPNKFGERTATVPGRNQTYYGNQKVSYAYLNDDWRVNQKLTLNLGVRYEYTEVPVTQQLQSLNTAASVPGLITFKAPSPQMTNFVPRIGFAYSVDTNTVVRGGFGMGYDVLYDNLATSSVPPQFSVTEDVDLSSLTPGFLAGGGLAASASPTFANVTAQRRATSGYVADQKLPYAENWSLGIERTFKQNYTAEVRYIGTRGIDLPTQTRLNRQNTVTATNQLPFYFKTTTNTSATALTLTEIEANGSSFVPAYQAAGFDKNNVLAYMPWAKSNYNGLATQLTRRFSHGLLVNAAYTWSKTMDDATLTTFGSYLTPRRPQDFKNLPGDYSRSALDHTHRLSFAVVYDLPFYKNGSWMEKNLLGNWEIAPVYTYQSPEYATVQSNVDATIKGDAAGDRVFINPDGVKGTGSASIPIYDHNVPDSVYGDPSDQSKCYWNDAKHDNWLCPGDTAGYYSADPTAYYVVAGAGTIPNAGRNTLPIRPIDDLDATAVKRITFADKYKLEFQAQVWNVLNHSQYVPGSLNNVNSIGYITDVTHTYLIPGSPNFNKPEETFSNNARSMQLALKLIF